MIRLICYVIGTNCSLATFNQTKEGERSVTTSETGLKNYREGYRVFYTAILVFDYSVFKAQKEQH